MKLQPPTPPTAACVQAGRQAGSDLARRLALDMPEAAAAPAMSSASVSASTEDSGSDEDSHGTPVCESGQEPWRPIATGFLTDFGQPGSDWVARITRWTAPAVGAQYAGVDLSRVLSAAFVSLEVVDAGEALVDVAGTYDDGQVLLVRIENSAQAWQVTRVEPAPSQDG